MENATSPSYLQPPSSQLDNTLLFFYTINMVVGIPGNIIALLFFRTQATDLPSLLYRITAINDITLLSSTVPTSVSLFYKRQPMWFKNQLFCTIFGMLQTILPAFSVAIVGTLCISRTVQLFLFTRKLNKKLILFLLFSYLAYLVISEAVPVLVGRLHFSYTSTEIYCWDRSVNSTKYPNVAYIDIAMDMMSFSLPVVPILLCCIVSTAKIRLSRKVTASNGNSLKTRATITIMIFTVTYVIFNIPIFVVQVLRVNLFTLQENYPGRYFGNFFMYQYGWNMAKMLLPACNAAVNPVIYLARIARYRMWLMRLCDRKAKGFKLTTTSKCPTKLVDEVLEGDLVIDNYSLDNHNIILPISVHSSTL